MKTAVFYYTQSGQALRVAQTMCQPMGEVVYKAIECEHVFPFPWSRRDFFDVFPETRLALPPFGIKPLDFSDILDADMVVVVGQSWFLSPSLPLQAFFTDDEVRAFLNGRKVVFMNVCRNMWSMTIRKVKEYLSTCGAKLVGHIVVQDEHANLVSAVTITRWLLHGRKEAAKLFPAAGVSEQNIAGTSRFGDVIRKEWEEGNVDSLQEHLLAEGAIRYQPSVMFIERVGHRIFGYWARFIRGKGEYGDARRSMRLTMFYYYLLFVLFGISPLAQLFFCLTYPLQQVMRNKREDCSVL